MTPMLGILASQITGHLSTNSFESIATVTVGSGGQSTISFTSIPSTFKHLQVRAIARGTFADNNTFPTIRFNSDSGNNYSWHILDGNGSTASAGAGTTTNTAGVPTFTGGTSGANMFGVMVYDVLDYTNTNKYKTARYLGGHDQNGLGILRFGSANWSNTSAITQIDFISNLLFAQYSSFALYGVKG